MCSCCHDILPSVPGASNSGLKSPCPSSFQSILLGIFVRATWKQPIYQCSHIQNKPSNDTYTYLIRHFLSYTIHTYIWATALPFEKQCTHLPKLVFKNLMFSSQEVMQQPEWKEFNSICIDQGLRSLAIILRLSPTGPTVFPTVGGPWHFLFSPSLQICSSLGVSTGKAGFRDTEQGYGDEVAQEVKAPASKPEFSLREQPSGRKKLIPMSFHLTLIHMPWHMRAHMHIQVKIIKQISLPSILIFFHFYFTKVVCTW